MLLSHKAATPSAVAGVCREAVCRRVRRKDALPAIALEDCYFSSFSKKRLLSPPTLKKSSAAEEVTY